MRDRYIFVHAVITPTAAGENDAGKELTMTKEAVTELSKIKELYRKDADFKSYVDRYCQSKELTVGEALQHDLVKEVGRYYATEHLQYEPKNIL